MILNGIAGIACFTRLECDGGVCPFKMEKSGLKMALKRRVQEGCLLLAALLAGCALSPSGPERIGLSDVTHFSTGRPGEVFPGGWRLWTFSSFKKPTEYQMVVEDGRIAIGASADSSASGLVHDVKIDPLHFPFLRWHWKVDRIIATADNATRQFEDSPARVVISFSGDRSKFSFDDRLFAAQIKAFTGQELPYATLMYIWGNRRPPESLISNSHSARIKMIVVQSGSDKTGRWLEETRNIADDFRRAFGEGAGAIHSVGIMTDTDNTGTEAQAFYGDITFMKSLQ